MALETKEKILRAALDLFSTRGYAAVGTRGIAEAAGVNEVTVFRSFGSKEKLWLEVFRRFVVRPEPEGLLAGTVGTPAADIAATVRTTVALLKSNTKLVRMSLRDLDQFPEVHLELSTQPRRMVDVLARHFRSMEGELRVPAEVFARTLVDTLFGVVIHFEATEGMPSGQGLDAWLEDFLPLLLGGVMVSPPH